MSSDFNYNFGLVVDEIFKLGYAIKSRCFDTKKNSYFDSSQRIIYTRIEVNIVSLLLWTNSLGLGILYEPQLTGTVAQKNYILNTRNKKNQE